MKSDKIGRVFACHDMPGEDGQPWIVQFVNDFLWLEHYGDNNLRERRWEVNQWLITVSEDPDMEDVTIDAIFSGYYARL